VVQALLALDHNPTPACCFNSLLGILVVQASRAARALGPPPRVWGRRILPAMLKRLVAHSALRDLVGAEEGARWVRELEEVEEEYPFLEYAAKLVRGEERVMVSASGAAFSRKRRKGSYLPISVSEARPPHGPVLATLLENSCG
jgi:hypothetical protein